MTRVRLAEREPRLAAGEVGDLPAEGIVGTLCEIRVADIIQDSVRELGTGDGRLESCLAMPTAGSEKVSSDSVPSLFHKVRRPFEYRASINGV